MNYWILDFNHVRIILRFAGSADFVAKLLSVVFFVAVQVQSGKESRNHREDNGVAELRREKELHSRDELLRLWRRAVQSKYGDNTYMFIASGRIGSK